MTETTDRSRKPRTWALMHYDKPHRCPASSGAGWSLFQFADEKYPECDGGYVPIYGVRDVHPRTWHLRTTTCPKCGIRVLPHALIALTGYWWTRILARKVWWFACNNVRFFRRRHGGI